MADDRADRLERAHGAAQVVADDRMLLHQRVLGARQLAFLEQHPIGNRDLADVVEERAAVERVEIVAVEIQRRAERGRVLREAVAVILGVRIARFDEPPERQEQRLRPTRDRRSAASAGSATARARRAPADRPAC